MGTTFDTNLYQALKMQHRTLALAGKGGGLEARRIGTKLRLLDVLGTARVNAALAADQPDAGKTAADALADVELALQLLQDAARDGAL